jgi:hypothetical protein
MLVAALAAAAGCALAQDSLRDFAYSVAIVPGQRAAFYEIALPRAVYEGVARDDLGDLRVMNQSGEVVPHAFVPLAVQQAKPAGLAATLFPLRGRADIPLARLNLHLEARPDSAVLSVSPAAGGNAEGERLLGYVADLSAHEDRVRAIELERPAGSAPFSTKLSVEGSDDLRVWRPLARDVPVLSLASGGQRLERLRVEFAAQRVNYLRLSWPREGPAVELAALKVESDHGPLEPEREWKSLAASISVSKPNEYAFEVGGRYPVDRVRVRLPQPNTVVPVEILTRADASDTPRTLVRATVYRLNQGDAELGSPDIPLPWRAQRELLLRVDPKGGGVGGTRPEVEVGWVPQRLVFVARGEGPFRLAYGSGAAMPSAYPIGTVVPGYGAEGEAGERARKAIAPARTGTGSLLAGKTALEKPIDAKRQLLWGTLVLAVALLAAMAWRLWQQASPASGARSGSGSKGDAPPSDTGSG